MIRVPEARPQCQPAYTLTEMLVTILIILILAAIIFSATSRLRSSADKAVCLQNLRGISNAIVGYAAENNDSLPGPIYHGQGATGNPATATGGWLGYYILKYLEGDVSIIPGKPYTIRNFGCPSQTRLIDTKITNASLYRMAPKMVDVNKAEKYPFSYPGYAQLPMKTSEIHPMYAGRSWAMIENDQTMALAGQATGPAHGDERMALFFDWSVKVVKGDAWKKKPY